MSKSVQPTPGSSVPGHPSAAQEPPRPEPIRFYGTSWVERAGGYRLRRVALSVGGLLVTVAGALVLTLGYGGLAGAETPGWLAALVALAFAICTVLAFTRQWLRYTRPAPETQVDESAFRSINVVGFVGVLLAYTLRSAVEAPGERLLRADYEAALARHRRLVTKRSGNPARRGRR
ncbi:hypothetical protein RM844_25155 [Streptomyces sp. DSM 44915]|uniref:Integral membrane protein n=1 Tax=Streptomyces chisholmiae TaxID=3075540 RepID=A0ABU2JX51_9ACTN|nr:hypothetical protein [Streptomyces sp. DSM 44915]MDT0269576.1 hypothetical protein [Streptomyces sp. DSM 44915]